MAAPALADVEAWLDRLYVAAEGARLRDEEHKKARELVGLLDEVGRALPGGKGPITLVDAAAGKAYVGLLAAALIVPRERAVRVVVLERDPARAERARAAAAGVARDGLGVDVVTADVADPAAWPSAPDVVVALHACGEASDHVIARATAAGARAVLVAPCCIAADIPVARRAAARAEAMGVPAHGEVRRQAVEAFVAAERTWRLEAAGYETVVAAFAPPTVTPYGRVWRARRVGEPVRTATAAKALARWEAGS